MLLALKIKLAAAAVAAGLAGPAMLVATAPERPGAADPPELVTVAAGPASYRLAGEFTREGRPVAAPLDSEAAAAPLRVMRRQVTAGEWRRCVAEGGCPAVKGMAARDELPAVGVNWHDAHAYAAWLSARRGERWRLPTDREWVRFAGERAVDDVLPDGDPADPARRWLARYAAESERAAGEAKEPRPAGAFGANRLGVEDLAGNVWEWTASCYERVALDPAAQPAATPVVNCGVRVVEGAHRTYMVDFVRESRAGGCALGVPPANLGFRLVRKEAPAAGRIAAAARRLLGRGLSFPFLRCRLLVSGEALPAAFTRLVRMPLPQAGEGIAMFGEV